MTSRNFLRTNPSYESLLKQEKLVKSFPGEQATSAHVQAWVTEYRATLGSTYPGYGAYFFPKFDGARFHALRSSEFRSRFDNATSEKTQMAEEMMQGFVAGRMFYRIEKAKRERARDDAAAAKWAKDVKINKQTKSSVPSNQDSWWY